MKQLKTKDFIIDYDENLQNFIEKTVKHAESKKKEFYNIFDCKESDIDILHVSFFVNREDFVEYIKSISNGQTPPSWATGCFYNGEIQVLVDLKNPEIKINTLAHETMHLFFDKTIYEKYNVARVNWLDESFAVYLDGQPNDISNEELARMIKYLSKISNGFDMRVLEDYNKVKTKEYNGYDMFNIIGKYIFETKQEQKFIELIKKDRNKVLEIGKHILQDAIDYFKEKL